MAELGYQTQYTDPQTGDVNMQARWYSPGTGTFRSRDTWPGNLNTPVSLNRYTYANNNPTRYSDPTGRCIDFSKPECRAANDLPGAGGNDGITTNDLKDPTRFEVLNVPAAAPAISFGDDLSEPAQEVAPAGWEANQSVLEMYATGIAPGEYWYVAAFDSPLEVYALTQDPCDSHRIATECMLFGAIGEGMTDYSMDNCRMDEITACGVSLVNVGSLVKSVGAGVGWLAGKFGTTVRLADDVVGGTSTGAFRGPSPSAPGGQTGPAVTVDQVKACLGQCGMSV